MCGGGGRGGGSVLVKKKKKSGEILGYTRDTKVRA